MLPIQRPPNSKLRYRTTIGKLHRKQTTSHTHVLSRRRHTFLGADLLEGGFGFVETCWGCRRCARVCHGLLDLGARDQTHLFQVYAYGGILSLFAVRNYLRRKKLPKQAGRRPTLSLGVLQPAFIGCRPRRLGEHILMRGRSCEQGR
jgi:hypothetical protein